MPKKKRCEPLDRYCQINGLTVADLAKQLKWTPSTVRSFVNGNRLISAERAVKIEGQLGIPRETLRPDIFVKRA